jgi:phosphatidylserine/phosphatidylglycerophosphate/cardiolipin synthase-like enzyme
MLTLLAAKAESGVVVTSRREALPAGSLAPHGKLLIIDDELALVGSMALSSSNLDRRREVGITVSDRRIVRQLIPLFEGHRYEAHHRGGDRLAGSYVGLGATASHIEPQLA